MRLPIILFFTLLMVLLTMPFVVSSQSPIVVHRISASGASPTPTPTPTPGTAFVLTQTVGTPRNDFTGCVGFLFTTTSSPPTISSLGRWVIAGNSGTHVVYVYNGSGIAASASINTSGATPGDYKYTAITPVALASSTTYIICSAETSAGDQWYGDTTTIDSVSSAVATAVQAEGATDVPPTSVNSFPGAVGQFSYGPVNFRF